MSETTPTRAGLRHPGVLAWLRLVRVYQQISRAAAEHSGAAGITLAQFDVLAQVGAAEGCNQQQLADALLVSKGNVTQLLDRMEECDLLKRRPVGRTKCVFLTQRGRSLRDRIVPGHEAVIASQFAPLAPTEQRELLRLLRRLDRALRQGDPLRT